MHPAPAIDAPQATETEMVVAGMLTENTGRHMLDSGGAYGRNWERNKGLAVADFKANPEASIEFGITGAWGNHKEDYAQGMVTIDVFHFLTSLCEFDADLDRAFRTWAEATAERRDESWMGLAETFAGDERRGLGIYGDGPPLTVNTYNNEDALSQVLQYTYWVEPDDAKCLNCEGTGTVTSALDDLPNVCPTCEGDGIDHERAECAYVLMSIHGGCDVRGGYTDPRVFRLMGDESTYIFDNARASLACDGERANPDQVNLESGEPEGYNARCGAYWDTDNAGYSWYAQEGPGISLEDYPVREGKEGEQGTVVIDPDDPSIAFCPVCGNGTLGVMSHAAMSG